MLKIPLNSGRSDPSCADRKWKKFAFSVEVYLSKDGIYVENEDQHKSFYIPFLVTNNLKFQKKACHQQPNYIQEENYLSANIRLKFRNMKYNWKCCPDIGPCVSRACSRHNSIVSFQELRETWIPLSSAADTWQISPTAESNHVDKEMSKYT